MVNSKGKLENKRKTKNGEQEFKNYFLTKIIVYEIL